MMKKDLVLETTGTRGVWDKVEIILPNIPSQRYVIGSVYPGEREGEDFVFCRPNLYDPVAPTHFVIRVDDGDGQYWIADCKNNGSTFKTFLNSNRVKAREQRLKSGDIVCFGSPANRPGRPPRNKFRHIFRVKERIIPNRDIQRDGEEMNELLDDPDSPLANDLILEKIMSYLPLEDLKNARLVSKKWKGEASKHLEKRGRVFFLFRSASDEPQYSTRVLRYLHEMRDLKIQNLDISLSPMYSNSAEDNSPQKIMDDLRKLLKSPHNFSTLSLYANILDESDFLLFSCIFQELGEKLVELRLEIFDIFLPAALPPFPLMNNLKKLSDPGQMFDHDSSSRWVSHFVPLFSNNLEHLICWNRPEYYLEEFLKHPMPNLKGLAIKGSRSVCERTFSALLELETRLTFLEIPYDKACPEPEEVLERLLLKNSKSLQHLVIRIPDGDYRDSVVYFPSFPKLEELELEYGRRARVSWDGHGKRIWTKKKISLSYKKQFPSLRKLTVRPLERWSDDDQVFNSFFPEEGNLRVETVTEVWIPAIPNDPFHPRMDQIKNMFPNATLGTLTFTNKPFSKLEWSKNLL